MVRDASCRGENPCLWCRDVWEQRSLFKWLVLLRLILGVARVSRGPGASQSPWIPDGEEKGTPVAEVWHQFTPFCLAPATSCTSVEQAKVGN